MAFPAWAHISGREGNRGQHGHDSLSSINLIAKVRSPAAASLPGP